MIAVVCLPAGVYALTQEQWVPAVVCLLIGPFSVYDAFMSYKAGNWS
jgi:hypothetical protein